MTNGRKPQSGASRNEAEQVQQVNGGDSEVAVRSRRGTLWARFREDRALQVLCAVILLGAVLRFLAILWLTRTPQGNHDPAFYRRYAADLALGRGYIDHASGEPTAYFPIGYPAFLTALTWFDKHVFGTTDVTKLAAVANLVLGTATIGLVARLGRRLVDVWTGVAAALVVAVYPNFVFHAAVLLSEPLFGFLIVLALVILLGPDRRPPSMSRLVAGGVVMGLATLVRPVALVIIPVVFVVGWIALDVRRALRVAAIVGAVAVLVCVPWMVRNKVVMGTFALSTNTGDNLCIGNNFQTLGHYDYPQQGCFDHPTRTTAAGEVAQNDELTKRAIRYALDHPSSELQLLWWRTYYTWYSDGDGLFAAESYGTDPFINERLRDVLRSLSEASNFVVLALAALGLPAFFRRRRPDRLLLIAFAGGLFLAILPFFGDPRFKAPIILFLAVPTGYVLRRVRVIAQS